MPAYRQQIPPRDRWAIAAYIRALQLSQHFPAKDLPDDLRAELDKQDKAGGRPLMSSSLAPADDADALDRLQQRSLGVGVVALVVCVVGAFFSPTQFFRAYLAAYVFYLGIGLGSLVILMIYHLTGGAWGFLVRRILEAATRTLPLLAVLFLPMACGVSYLYLWARPDTVAADPEPAAQADLSQRAVLLRPGRALFRRSGRSWPTCSTAGRAPRTRPATRAAPPDAAAERAGPGGLRHHVHVRRRRLDHVAAAGVPLDHLRAAGRQLRSCCRRSPSPCSCWSGWSRAAAAGRVRLAGRVRDLGNLLLTFLILWAYMVFFQFMLIWIANLPYEVIWYLPRVRDGWQWVTWALFLFCTVVPFFVLLMRDVKRNPAHLAKVAGLLLFMQLVFAYYQVVPAFPTPTIGEHWMDFLTPFGRGRPVAGVLPLGAAAATLAAAARPQPGVGGPPPRGRCGRGTAGRGGGPCLKKSATARRTCTSSIPTVRVEPTDASFRPILFILLGTVVVAVLIYVVVWWFFDDWQRA